MGLGPLYIDLDRHIRYPTIAREAVSGLVSRESRSEEMRVLYVGMTRAKEKLIMTASMRSAQRRLKELAALSALPVPPETVDSARSMAEWILLPLLQRREAAPLRELAGLEEGGWALTEDSPWAVSLQESGQYGESPSMTARTEEAAAAGTALPVYRAALDFVYPYKPACITPTKLTATQLKGREKDKEIAQETIQPYVRQSFSAPRFLSGQRSLTSAEKGTATHLVMQYLPFDENTDVDAVVEDLVVRRLLTREQADAVDQEEVRRFLSSPLASQLRRAEQNGRVEREYRFSLLLPGKNYFSGLEAGEEVLLQGVVDLFTVEDGAVTVVDFKTDYVTQETLPEKTAGYRPQLEAYSAALERILELPVKRRILYFFRLGQAVEV